MNLIDAFLEVQRSLKSPHTLVAYRLDLIAWETFLNSTPLASATSRHVIEYRHQLADNGKKPATINRALASLKSFYAWTTDNGYTSSNITASVKMKRATVDNTTLKWLTPQQTETLILTLDARQRPADIRDKAILYCMLYAGLRVSEVCALQVDDVTLKRGESSILVRFGKGDKSRTVPANDKLTLALRVWLAERNLYKLSANSTNLFVSERLGHLTRSGIDAMASERYRAAGIDGHSSHSLRHTFAKRLAERGVRLEEIAKLCGHTSIQTTMIYVTPSATELRRAVQML